MATGDIISAEIINSPSNKNGWVLQLTIEGWAGKTLSSINTGWTAPNNSLGNNPSTDTPTINLVATSPGFEVDGNEVKVTTNQRTIWGTRRIRRPHSLQAQFETENSKFDLLIQVALSDSIFKSDASVFVTIPAGAISATDSS
jgi:hypothetical protein